MAVMKRVCDTRHRPIRKINPDVPAWLEATIDRLLAKEPADRFQTATEVADLLERGLAHLQQPTIVPAPRVPEEDARRERDGEIDSHVIAPWSRVRRLAALAAGLAVVAVGGLGVTEAAGLTQVSDFVATVLRIKTPEGTLIVKVEDPSVKIQVDGEELVIKNAGEQEIRLRAGSHRVQAIKDGKAVRDQLVTITRGGKEIVNVDFEPAVQNDGPIIVGVPGTSYVVRPVTDQNMAVQSFVPGQGKTTPDAFGPSGMNLAGRPAAGQEMVMQNGAAGRGMGGRLNPDHGYRLLMPKRTAYGTAEPQQNPQAHPERVRAMVWSLAFSPDGQPPGHRPASHRSTAVDYSDLGYGPSPGRCVVFAPSGIPQSGLLGGRSKPGCRQLRRDVVVVWFCRRLEDPIQRKPGLGD